ncbi:ankyrin repeat-containing protein [Anaeramoeba ignava]|uniref:Ankyrin repeat-containing protein n=1 Tax=Anaeramoeba ignava TaxID=1746090 RepID=A0A9Q0L5Z4_ANAIG|nr:ankyrin repeat-containing protein [Anaeramoeba ignava]
MDEEIDDKRTQLHFACEEKSFNNIKILLEKGADPNSTDSSTPLHYACSHTEDEKIIRLLLNYGANPFFENNLRPIDFIINRNYRDQIEREFSFFLDFYNFFENVEESGDFKIPTKEKEKEIFAHKDLLEWRFGEKFEEIIMKLKEENEKKVTNFLSFVYSGISENPLEAKQMWNNFGLAKKEMYLNQELFEKLYQDENSKTFKIICHKKSIKAHKFILMAKSGLFYSMFSFVTNDNSNQVNDYTEKSFESLNQLIKFLYLGKLDQNLSVKILNELEEAEDFYILNSRCGLKNQIDKLLMEKMKKKKKQENKKSKSKKDHLQKEEIKNGNENKNPKNKKKMFFICFLFFLIILFLFFFLNYSN